MKISYNWLKDYYEHGLDPQTLADTLTMLGLEAEGAPERVGGVPGNFEGVVVGHVLSAVPHPNADRLRLCSVDVGGEAPLHIVCGAPNVAAGQKVPVATIGTLLYPQGAEAPLKIKEGKIRGELSQGMICAEDELGIGSSHEGIIVLDESIPVGTPFAEVSPLKSDWLIHIGLTPNRIDAASHFGTARDLAAAAGHKAILPHITLSAEGHGFDNPIPVTLSDTTRCRRYCSILIEGIQNGESPEWLKSRLTTIGLRPRNTVVDITNYVLHELGHPLHAFDADHLGGNKVVVRTLDEDQDFVTLDGETRRLLAGQDLMICDAARPHCIAGVMGGAESSVTMDTTRVFLESAWFEPVGLRRTAKRLGISSDSSFRFERGADPHMAHIAALRAASLIVELCGGRASRLSDVEAGEFPPHEVKLSVRRCEQMIGKAIGKTHIVQILKALEIEVQEEADGDTLQLRVPPYRVDVTRPQDVMEEVLRIYGYNNVAPAARMVQTMSFNQYRDLNALRQRYSDYLSANGYYEVMNISLYSRALAGEHAITLFNPLSEELDTLRQSMLPGLLENIRHNQNRQEEELAIYEFGKTYAAKGGRYSEKQWLAFAVSGSRAPMHWSGKAAPVSLYTLTREAERMQDWFGFRGELREAQHPDFDYGLELIADRRVILQYGRVNNEWATRYDLRNEVFAMYADWEALTDLYDRSRTRFQPVPQYPSLRRDVSIIIDDARTWAELRRLVASANPKLIRSVDLYDVYRGQNIAGGKKSYLISVLMRDDSRTLEDTAADKTMDRVRQLLSQQAGAELRM